MNPFHISEEVVSDLRQASLARTLPSDHKAVMSRSERLQTLMGYDNIIIWDVVSIFFRVDYKPITKEVVLTATTPISRGHTIRHTEKEDMRDFIGKKREMFLVQMSLDTKRDEV